MSASTATEQLTDDDQTLDELIQQKVEDEVERRVAEETADLRQELAAEKERSRGLERALAERDKKTTEELAPISSLRYGFAMLANALTGADVDYSAQPHKHEQHFSDVGDTISQLVDRVEDAEQFIDQYGEGKEADQDEAWYKVVQSARNLYGNPNHTAEDGNKVILYVDDVDQAVSYTNRHCSNLIETFGEEKKGATWKKYKPKSAGENNKERRKRLVIDMDVWGDD